MDYTSLIKEVNIPELVKALRMCMGRTCPICDFYNGNGCRLGGYMKITLDAAAAIEALQTEVTELKRVNLEIFEDLPKRGEWVRYMRSEFGDMWLCSNCHTYVRLPFRTNNMPYDFCPSCGADMRKMEVQP